MQNFFEEPPRFPSTPEEQDISDEPLKVVFVEEIELPATEIDATMIPKPTVPSADPASQGGDSAE